MKHIQLIILFLVLILIVGCSNNTPQYQNPYQNYQQYPNQQPYVGGGCAV